MADFNFYLNRQGIQGRKGDKGDAGFTPTISVSEQTLNSYKLKITNEYNEFETPNLIGNLGVTDNGGTYLRYDPATGAVSTGEIDGATTEVVGGVRKSTDTDLTNLSADTVVTPANVADMLPLLLEAGTDNVTITQDEATSKTKISVTNSSSGDVTAAGNNRFTGDNTFTGKVNIAGGALTVDGVANLNQTTAQYLNAVNITSAGEVNATSIKANGLRSDDIQTTENKKYLTELDVDNQTIQVINGKLHCNLDELGNEVNSLTGDVNNLTGNVNSLTGNVNSLTGEVTDLTGRVTANEADISAMKTGKQNKLTAGANVTLTDLTDGTVRIDATGGGGTGDIPIASATTLGGIKVGKNLTIDENGTLNATGGSGTAIDDATTSTTSTWSSSKINSEITTDIENLKNTKNNNIFDLSKFTVVGSPTITDDGITSGFSASNYIKIPYDWAKDVTNFKITGKFKVENAVQGTNYILGYVTKDYSMGLSFNSTSINWFAIKTSSENVNLYKEYSITPNIDYSYELQLNNNLYTLRLFDDTGSAVVNLSKSTSSLFSITDNYLRLGVSGNYVPSNFMTGSIDLSHFSITVDGKEVFNGLMESTKPIYDAIKANNTELSEFKTETSTDISAVNSALNEKANLTDLALKQNTLVSGTNIKTINGETILGEGNITVGGSTGDIPIATTTTAGKVKPDGTTITITDDGTISAVGGGGGGATIDDSTTATTSVWSSSKTNTEISTVANEVAQVQGNVASLDGDVSTLKTDVSGLKTDVSGLKTNVQNAITGTGDQTFDLSSVSTKPAFTKRWKFRSAPDAYQNMYFYQNSIKFDDLSSTSLRVAPDINSYGAFSSGVLISKKDANNYQIQGGESSSHTLSLFGGSGYGLLLDGNIPKISTYINNSTKYPILTTQNTKAGDGISITTEGDNVTISATGGGSTPTNMVTTDTAQDITANKTFYGEIRVGADNNYAILAKFSKEALASGDSTLLEHIDLGEASFVVQGSLGKKVYETDKYVYKKYINVDDLSDSAIKMDNSISSQVTHMAMPSNKYINLTLGASGTTYTAPADGYFTIFARAAKSVRLDALAVSCTLPDTEKGITGTHVPVKKGETMYLMYNSLNLSESWNYFRFVYAVGSEPVA